MRRVSDHALNGSPRIVVLHATVEYPWETLLLQSIEAGKSSIAVSSPMIRDATRVGRASLASF